MITDEYEAVKNQFNMTDKEYEEAITHAIASTCHFILGTTKRYWHCLICQTRLPVSFIGRDVNERMLDHYSYHTKRNKHED